MTELLEKARGLVRWDAGGMQFVRFAHDDHIVEGEPILASFAARRVDETISHKVGDDASTDAIFLLDVGDRKSLHARLLLRPRFLGRRRRLRRRYPRCALARLGRIALGGGA